MLELLTKSKIRKKIILLFLYNQDKEYYLNEIAKIVGTSAGTTQRELNKLIASDLVLYKKRGGLSIYALNKQYSLLEEIESIAKKTIGVEFELKNELGDIKGIDYAFIFGSFVKEGFKSNSDIDLFIIGEVAEDAIFKTSQKVEKVISRTINYHLADKAEFLQKLKKSAFYKDIIKDCILLKGEINEFRRYIRTPYRADKR